ncbi:MAG: beta strand repeat-containing protein [Solirubrobacterales bacterium]
MESIGNGNCTLNQVQVTGTTYVRGGGPKSIQIKSSILPKVEINKPNRTTVRLLASAGSKINTVTTRTPATLEESGILPVGFQNVIVTTPAGAQTELRGSFEIVRVAAVKSAAVLLGSADQIQVESPLASVRADQGTVGQLSVTGSGVGTSVILGSKALVGVLKLDGPATVKTNAHIQNVAIGAPGSTISLESAAVVNNVRMNAPGSVTGSGIVHNAYFYTSGGMIEQDVPNVTVSPKVICSVDGKLAVNGIRAPELVNAMIALDPRIAGNTAMPNQQTTMTPPVPVNITVPTATATTPNTLIAEENLEEPPPTITISGNASNVITISSIKIPIITVGQTKEVLLANGLSDAQKTVSSSNSSVVTAVLNGNAISLTGIANGKAIITITASKPGFQAGTRSFGVVVNSVTRSLSWGAGTFHENSGNTGAIDNSNPLSITLTGDTFTGEQYEDLVTTNKIQTANVPAGLTMSVVKTAPASVAVTLTGQATNHAIANNVTNMSLRFLDTAFAGGSAESVSQSSRSTLGVTFKDAGINYGTSVFNETGANDGSIDNSSPMVITLAEGAFSGAYEEDFVSTGKLVVTNLPAGLTAVAKRISAIRIEVTLVGKATLNNPSHNRTDVTFAFQNAAFSGGTSSNYQNATKGNIEVRFIAPGISYDNTEFVEAAANNGTIDNDEPMIIRLTGETFTGSVNDDFVALGRMGVTNVPSGLTVVAKKTGSQTISVTLTGTVTNHQATNSVSTLGFKFYDNAFVGNDAAAVNNQEKTNLKVSFQNPELIYSGVMLTESSNNDGTFGSPITVTLTGDTFAGADGENFAPKVSVSALPAGLTAVLTRTSATTLTFGLTGVATAHNSADSVRGIRLTYQNSAFTSGNAAQVSETSQEFDVIFIDPGLSASASGFSEAGANDGSISGTVTVTLTGDLFSGITGDDFVAAGKILVSNQPAGLTVTAVRSGAHTITVGLNGNAAQHNSGNGVTNMTLAFQSSAFATSDAAQVNNTAMALSVSFSDPTLTYSAGGFFEAADNTGSIDNSSPIVITLAGDTFTGGNGDDLVALGKVTTANVPVGLTAVVTRTSGTTLSVTLIGTANPHFRGANTGNLTITFTNTAFAAGNAAIVSGYSRSNLTVDFVN